MFKNLVESKARHRREVAGAHLIKRRATLTLRKKGPTKEIRDGRRIRSALLSVDTFTRDGREQAAANIMTKFLITWTGRVQFRKKCLTDLPELFNKWRAKGVKTMKMR